MFNHLNIIADAAAEPQSTVVGDIILVAVLVILVAVLSFVYIKRKKDRD